MTIFPFYTQEKLERIEWFRNAGPGKAWGQSSDSQVLVFKF